MILIDSKTACTFSARLKESIISYNLDPSNAFETDSEFFLPNSDELQLLNSMHTFLQGKEPHPDGLAGKGKEGAESDVVF
jgi:hypothetical protein